MTDSVLTVSSDVVKSEPQSRMHEAYGRLCEVEEQFDLLQHTIDGWSVWPLLRFEVSLLLAGVTFEHRHIVLRSDRIRRALADLPALFHLRQARHLVKTYSSGLIDRNGDSYRDIWFDDVLIAAGSTFKIELVNNAHFARRRAAIPRDMTSALIHLGAAILRCVRVRAETAEVSRAVSHVLTGPLALPQADEEWVGHRLARFCALKTVYGLLLRRVRPSYVLVADAGDHALMAASKEQGIVALELQHGICDGSNASYAWPASARRYRRTMPIPDRLLLYGEHWKRELEHSGFWGDDLRVVGSPRLDRYRSDKKPRDGARCEIVFTTQGLDIGRTSAFFREFLERTSRTLPLHLTIKLHPVYDAEKKPYLDALAPYSDRVSVFGSDEGPSTFELLQRAHLHVSIASASHYDALGLGVTTVILPFQTYEVVLPLYQTGHALLAATPEALVNIARGWRELRVPVGVGEYYFAPGGCANILRELGLSPDGTK
jgi:hypothetical protein